MPDPSSSEATGRRRAGPPVSSSGGFGAGLPLPPPAKTFVPPPPPPAATSCAPYTRACYLAGSPQSCARLNTRQTPDNNRFYGQLLARADRGASGGRPLYGLVASRSVVGRAEGEHSADRVCRPPAPSDARGYPRARG